MIEEYSHRQVRLGTKTMVFMFPSIGNHYLNMGKKFYEIDIIFREQVDHLCMVAEPLLHFNLKEILYCEGDDESTKKEYQQKLNQLVFGQPALFITEYALARMLAHKGIKPDAMIGYSIGEYTVASISGVMSPEDTLSIIIRRAQIIQELPKGLMTVALLPAKEISPMLGNKLSICVIASPFTCTVGGPLEDVADFEKKLKEKGIFCSRFGGSDHAVHTNMMEPIKDKIVKLMETIQLNAPRIPYISNVTGKWITEQQATDPVYWFKHTRHTVRFADGLGELMKNRNTVFLEVGPGNALGSFVRQQPEAENFACDFVLPTMPRNNDVRQEQAVLAETLKTLGVAKMNFGSN